MFKWFNKALLVLVIFIASFPISSVQARTVSPKVDAIRLQHAGDFVNAKNYKQGYASFKSMAKNGCPYSQCIIGIMRQNGTGVKKNATQAKYWLQKSARQGFADAENRLGLMYYRGDGIKKNLVLAKQWLTKAANHGVEEARILLAQIPGETKVANGINQAPQVAAVGAVNIEKSWQGYSQVTAQLNQLSSAAQIQYH